MFGRTKRSGVEHGAASAESDGPDLSVMPPFPAEIPGGLAAVDPAVIASYVNSDVVAILPLENGTWSPLDAGLPGVGTAGNFSSAPAGKAEQEARMRASGMSEEQIAMVRARISQAAAEHQPFAWTVVFNDGRQACVQVFPTADDGEFGRLKARLAKQSSRRAGRGAPDSLIEARVSEVAGAHYESYQLGGLVVARGRRHEAISRCAQMADPRSERVLAALAALGLWAVEG